MKKLTTLLCAVLIGFSVQAQTLLSEDFTTFTNDTMPPLASGWKNIDSLNTPQAGDSIWRFDNPGSRTFNTPISYPAAIIDSDWYGNGNSQDAYLISPPFDASNDSIVLLELDHYYLDYFNSSAEIQVFDSISWQTVATYTATTNNPEHEVIDISSIAAGESYVQIRFHYVGTFSYYWIVDNIVVYQPVPEDIRLVTVDSLKSSCNLTATETISATFENISSDTLSSVPLNYRINGGAIVTEVYSSQVLPNDVITYTFNTTADFSTVGVYDIEVFSTVRNDINLFNDTAYGTTINKPSLSSFPYFEDFESGAGNWADGGANSSWELGTPNGAVINSAASGSNAWVTSLRSDYNNNEESYVVSPCFDFSSLTQPQIKMKIWVESENSWDGTVLQATTDGGQSWQKVGDFGDPNNWYNDNTINGLDNIEPSEEGWTGTAANIGTGAWVLAENDLSGLAGEPSVELRIVFGSDGSLTEEGFAFDDVLIQEAPPYNLKAIEMINPSKSNSCGYSAADSVKFKFANIGSVYATNFNLGYILNTNNPVIEAYTDTIFPGDTLIYTFDSTANLSATVNYLFELFTALGTDADLTNDTIVDSVFHRPSAAFPFTEDFETGSANAAFSFITNPNSNVMVRAGAANNSLFGLALEGSSVTNYFTPNATNVWTTNPEHFASAKFCLDLTTATAAELTYDLMQGYNFNDFYTNLRVTINGNQVGLTHRPNGATTPWQTITENLNAYVGQVIEVAFESMVKYDSTTNNNYNYVDNILIQLPPSDDISANEIINPKSGCGLPSNDSVIVKVVNLGALQACNFTISFDLNGVVVNETYTACLNPGDSLFYTFQDSVDLSSPGSYNLSVYTSLSGDLDTSNDTISASIESIPIVSTFPYSENFENGNGGWTSGGANNTWALGLPSNTIINSAASGLNSWATNLTGQYNSDEESYVQGPCFDLSTLTDPVIKMKVWWNSENSWDGAVLQSSTDAGATWQKVGGFGDPNNWYTDNTINGLANLESSQEGWTGRNSTSNGSGTWVLAENDLTGLGGTPSVLFRIAFGSDGSVQDEGFAFDDITIMERPQSDVGIESLVRPTTNCGLSSADSIEVSIFSNSSITESNVPIIIILNDTITITDTLSSINAGDTTTIVLDSTVDLSIPGDYRFKIYTGLGTDGNPVNDTITVTITNIPILSSFPYVEDFESGNGGWTSGGLSSSWALGAPSNTIINSAASGTNAWVTNLSGNYNSNEESYVNGPCFDLSTLTDPVIKMNVWWNSENSWDGAVLQSSIDGGASWQKVGAFGDPNNWYTDNTINGLSNLESSQEGWSGRNSTSNGSGTWVLAEHNLSGLGGQSSVLLRIAFGSDGSVQDEGFAFDDVTILEKPQSDLGVVELIRPRSACGLSSSDSVEVKIFSNSINTETNVPIIIVINDTLTVTDTLASINAGDSVTIVFASTVNLSVPGNYTFKIYTSLGTDGNPSNDTISVTITNIPVISSFPYNEDFENGTGSWTTAGINNSWEHGVPNNTVINSAASGSNAWVTNLDGDYNGNEESYVISPCFDFTNLSQPLVKLNVWWESENSWDGAVLQSSIDGGTTWQKVGDFGDPNNWYNDNTINGLSTLEPTQEGWTGRNSTSNGSGGWLLAENDLSGLGGQASVQLRIAFGSDGFANDEGFAFDDFLIMEAPPVDLAVKELIEPVTQCGFGIIGDSVKIKVKNFGSSSIDTIPLGYVVNGGTPVIDTAFTTLQPGDSLIFTFVNTTSLAVPGSYQFELFSHASKDGNIFNDTLVVEVLNSQMVVPTTVDFDNLPSGQFGNFDNDWVGSSSDPDYQWYSNIGGTTSGLTGPNADHTSGSGTYMYTEASSPAAQGDTAWLTSPCMDLANSIDPALVFWYHMYGTDIETLSVQIDSLGYWVTVDTIAGQQHTSGADPFLSDTISLVNYNNLNNTSFRFQMLRGSDYEGDVAIDDVELASIPVGIVKAKSDLSEQIAVYPNPTNNYVNVVFNNKQNQSFEIELVDIHGKKVFETTSAKSIQIDLSGLAKGVYLLRFHNSKGNAVKRIIIQ